MTFPFPKRPQIEVLFTTDFSEYAVGTQPFDWSIAGHTGDITLATETLAGSLSGKAVLMTVSSGNRRLIAWNRPPASEFPDVEILMRAHKAQSAGDNETLALPFMRAVLPATEATMTCYVAGLIEGHEDRVSRYLNGNQDDIISFNGEHIGTGTGNWYWQRARIVGNVIQVKHWVFGGAEPAYQPDVINSEITAGGAVGWFTRSNNDMYVDYFAVSLGNPGVPPTPIPLPV